MHLGTVAQRGGIIKTPVFRYRADFGNSNAPFHMQERPFDQLLEIVL